MKQIVNSIPKPVIQPVLIGDVNLEGGKELRLGLKAYPDEIIGRNYYKYILVARDYNKTFSSVAFIRDAGPDVSVWSSADSVKSLVEKCVKDSRCEVFLFDSNIELAKWILEN